jgi:hypothetical protein
LLADAALKQAIGAAAAVVERVESADVEANKARPLLEAALVAEDAATKQLQLAEAEAGAAESMHTLGDQLDEACNEARGQVLDLERELQAAKAQEAELKRIVEQEQQALDEAQKQAEKAKKWNLLSMGAQKQKALHAVAEQLTKQATDVAKAATATQRVTSLGVTLERQTRRRDELQRELERDVAATTAPGSAPAAPASSYIRWPWQPASKPAPAISHAPVTPSPKPPPRPVSTLRCGHQFHADCAATWIRIRTVCPTCMQPIDMRRALLEGALGVER